MTDPNGQITSYVYDSMLRPTEEVKTPDGGQTITTYSSPNAITVANAIVSTTYLFDGLGHLTQTQLTSDPEGTDYTDTSYDTLGRVASVSNPHRSSGSYTDGTTQYQYDALNRITAVIDQDGSVIRTTYDGNCSTTTDEAGVATGACIDALDPNRITVVGDGLGNSTSYGYDPLDSLTSVIQAGSRQRTELSCGETAAREVFERLTGRFPAGEFDRVVQGDKEFVFRAESNSSSGSAAVEIVDHSQRSHEVVHFNFEGACESRP